MTGKHKLLVIIGSAQSGSSNELLASQLGLQIPDFEFEIFNRLNELPHFNPEQSLENPPRTIVEFRDKINRAEGVLICTPEYIFSIPSGLKNALEWCVATTVFSGKPVGLITASAHGQKGHEELQLIMHTLTARFTPENTLLISGIKGKLDKNGVLTDKTTRFKLDQFMDAFRNLIKNN